MISSAQCSVPISDLRGTPFSLAWGSSVYAKLIATNIYGDSSNSNTGNGAIILTSPDPPLNIAYNSALCSATQIAVIWTQGLANGGTPVIDYRVWYD